MKRYFIFSILLLGACPVLASQPPLFSQIRTIICDTEMENVLDRKCQENDFNVPTQFDLNEDGKQEWLYLGKGRWCGASGNCMAFIVQQSGRNWRVIWSGGGRILWRLLSIHQGYADLVNYGHNTACESAFDKYVWDGRQYHSIQHTNCDYCAEEKGKQLPAICNTKFQEALFCTICE